jgi:acyl carrier protein
MTNTLGLVDDGDDLDLLVDLEACFGIGITNSEAAACSNVGDL